MFYALGSPLLFEIIKNINNGTRKRLFLFSLARVYGYAHSYVRRKKRPVSEEFVKYVRNEQWTKLRTIFIKKGKKQNDQN